MNRGFASFISIGVATLKLFCAASGVSLSTGAARSFLSATRDLLSCPALLGHREGKVRLRPAARRCSASATQPFGSWFLPVSGTLQESTPWHLGAAFPRVRSG
jgi:hypothetical protein